MPSAKDRYEQLKPLRSQALYAAEKAAALTIVTAVPEFQEDSDRSNTGRERLPAPYQMVGAEGVNNLSSKITLAWLPPSQSFVRLKVSDADLEAAGESVRVEIEADLLTVERAVMDDVEVRKARPVFHEAIKHLLMAGNACMSLIPGKSMRLYPLSSYVTVWDEENNLIELVIEERLTWATLPADLVPKLSVVEPGEHKPDDTVLLHTWAVRAGGKFKTHQEVGNSGLVVENSEASYDIDTFPYFPARWAISSTHPYGFGLIEEYQGALEQLEGLTQAISEGVAASVKVVFLVNPNGTTRADELARTENGGFAEGSEEDVSVLQVQKQADLSVAAATRDELKRDLSRVFLLNSAVTRNAERVTAEEIRLLQLELDTALGGVFASLGQTFSLWLVRVIMKDLAKRKQIPNLSKIVKPTIVTGIEALGRGHEVNRLAQAIGLLTQLGVPLDQAGLKIPEVSKAVLVGSGVDIKDILMTPEELQAQQQQLQQQQLIDSVGSDVVRASAQQAPQG